MKLTEIKAIATQKGVKPGKMGKEDLVRAIQAAEGNNSCYNTGKAATCDQAACSWRGDCM